MVFLDNGNIRKINTGKSIITLGPLFFTSGTGNDFSVKYNIYPVSLVMGSKAKTVSQIGTGVGILHMNRFLGPGDGDRRWRILDQIGKSSSCICHGICSMGDHKTIVFLIMFFNSF